MFNPGSEIRLTNYRTDNLYAPPSPSANFTTKVLEGQVVDIVSYSSTHWALKVRQYAPTSVLTQGVLQFDDGTRLQLASAATDPYHIVSVVNCTDGERIKALYSKGDKITYFTGRWQGSTSFNVNNAFITVAPSEEFWATCSYGSPLWNFQGGFIDPTVANSFTTISGFTGTMKLLNAPSPAALCRVIPKWNTGTSQYDYFCISAGGSFPVQITFADAGFPVWEYTGEAAIGFDTSLSTARRVVTDAISFSGIMNRCEFAPDSGYPYMYGNGNTITDSDGTINGGSCKIIPIGIGAVVDVTPLPNTNTTGFTYTFFASNSGE